MMNKGFTLVEVLVVMAITIIVGVMLVVIFTNTLRGSNKAQILAVIKQNGQSVLDNIDKNIRNADNVVCVSDDGTTMVVVKNGAYTRYRYIAPSAVSGLIQQDNPIKQDVMGTSPLRKETDTELINRVCLPTDPMTNASILTDTNTQTGVSMECINNNDCTGKPIFAKNPSAGYKDQIIIQFNLKPGIGIPTAVSSQIDPVSFQTTIELR